MTHISDVRLVKNFVTKFLQKRGEVSHMQVCCCARVYLLDPSG